MTKLETRAGRFAAQIERCGTRQELCDLLKVIIAARMSEPEFSALYAAAVRRAAWLKNEAKRG